MEKNVTTIERWVSLLGGGALAAWALRERRLSPLSGALAIGAATLLFRGATGHCPAYGALGVSTADLQDDWARPLSGPREGARRGARRGRGGLGGVLPRQRPPVVHPDPGRLKGGREKNQGSDCATAPSSL